MKNGFITKRIVQKSEIDELNHVNNVVYLQWVQDIAGEHWKVLSKDLKENNFVWVVIRHEIDYRQQAVLNDELTLKTWVGETSGFKSIRNVEIYRGETLLAKAKTTWCLLDAKTFKPIRISENIINVLLPPK